MVAQAGRRPRTRSEHGRRRRIHRSREQRTPSGAAADAYGRFVARNVVAVNHDHYFSFRLDLDVDGDRQHVPDRSAGAERLCRPDSPRRSIWVREEHFARNASTDGMLDMDMHQPALWRVVSDGDTNHVGYPTSYQLMPGMSAMTLLSDDDYPRRRAGFIDHHLWTTPYRPEERYAAGDHPTLSKPGQGLPTWTKAEPFDRRRPTSCSGTPSACTTWCAPRTGR